MKKNYKINYTKIPLTTTFYIFFVFITICFLCSPFLSYCASDPTLEFINRLGGWGVASLWQASKVFCVYALADLAWNVHFVGPRILRSFFFIKWGDKLNSFFSFESKGELERYIERQTYTPLYSSITQNFYPAVIEPIKSVWKPSSNIVVETATTDNVNRVEIIKYVPVLDINELNLLKEQNQRLYSNQVAFQQNISAKYNAALDRFDSVLEEEGHELIPVDYMAPFLIPTYFSDKLLLEGSDDLLPMSDDGSTPNFLHELNPQFPNAFTPETLQIINNDVDNTNFSNSIEFWSLEINGSAVIPNTTHFSGGYRTMLEYPCSYEIPIVDIFYLTDKSGDFVRYLMAKKDQKLSLTKQNNSYYVEGFRTGPILAFSDSMKGLTQEVDTMATSLAPLSAAYTSLIAGVVGVVAHAADITTTLGVINNFNACVHNVDLGVALAQTFINYGQPVPDILQQYANHCTTGSTPQDVVVASHVGSAASAIPTPPNVPTFLYAVGCLVATSVICYGVYYWVTQTGMDINGVTEAKSGVVNALRAFDASVKNKYIN